MVINSLLKDVPVFFETVLVEMELATSPVSSIETLSKGDLLAKRRDRCLGMAEILKWLRRFEGVSLRTVPTSRMGAASVNSSSVTSSSEALAFSDSSDSFDLDPDLVFLGGLWKGDETRVCLE